MKKNKDINTGIELYLENLAKRDLFSGYSKLIKVLLAYPRYFLQVKKASKSYYLQKDHYPKPIILIAGLPKSGTTWLEELLIQFPGFSKVNLPEISFHESKTGGSHDLNLSLKIFSRLENTLSVIKVHSNASKINIDILRETGINYVVMYRDLRDVAVSYYHFVSQRPWHPEYHIYKALSIQEGLNQFAETLLPVYRDWICNWHNNYSRDFGIEVRYEDLLLDTIAEFTRIAKHFHLPHTEEQIEQIVFQYKVLRNQHKKGQNLARTHFRKGISGEWKEHFNPEIKNIFKEKAGKFLIEFGYEEDLEW